MSTPGGSPFGGYTTPSILLTNAEITALKININRLKALIPDPAVGRSAPHTDFDLIHPETARKLRAEIDALMVALDATPSV